MADHNSRMPTIKEVIVLLVVVIIAVLILLPGLTATRGDPGWVRDMSDMRQIGVAIYSYAADHKTYGPGLDSEGRVRDGSVENRYRALLEPGYLPYSDILISFYDDKTAWTNGPVHTGQYSYAMLQLPEQGGRLDQWKMLSAAAEAAWLSSRNTSTDAARGVKCLETDTPGDWRGVVVWVDGHATRETTHYLDTRYVPTGPENEADNLFEAAGDDDAYMVYTGE